MIVLKSLVSAMGNGKTPKLMDKKEKSKTLFSKNMIV